MSFQTCWRCLTKASDAALLSHRPVQQPWIILPSSMAPFSTSAPLLVLQPKKKGGVVTAVKNERGVKRTFTKKKDKVQKLDRSRRPAIGERKALRKRIVLSNTNALEVQGLRDFSAESMIDERTRGQILGIPDQVVVQLRTVEAFKVTQGWPLFRRPAMLVRRETLDLGREMEQIGPEGSKRTIRRVLVGERGSGKTVILLQAMSMAFLQGWVVLNIPEGMFISLFRDSARFQLIRTSSCSPGPHPCSHRIRSSPRHKPNPISTENLHRQPPLRPFPCQPNTSQNQPLPTPIHLRNPHSNPPQHLALPTRPPRCIRSRNSMAHLPAPHARSQATRRSATDDVPRRLGTRDARQPLHLRAVQTHTRTRPCYHPLLPRSPLRHISPSERWGGHGWHFGLK